MQPQSGGGSGLTHRMSAPCTGPSSKSPEWTFGAGPGDDIAATKAVASNTAPRAVVCKNRLTVLLPNPRSDARDMRLLRSRRKPVEGRDRRVPPGAEADTFRFWSRFCAGVSTSSRVVSRPRRTDPRRLPIPEGRHGDSREDEGSTHREEGPERLTEEDNREGACHRDLDEEDNRSDGRRNHADAPRPRCDWRERRDEPEPEDADPPDTGDRPG